MADDFDKQARELRTALKKHLIGGHGADRGWYVALEERCEQDIASALRKAASEGREAGAESMRERAAKIAQDSFQRWLVERIRALPSQPKEGEDG